MRNILTPEKITAHKKKLYYTYYITIMVVEKV
jgi:hypothetical protein